MAPTAQRPAPVTGIAAAHKILDTKVIDLVKANAPGQVNQVPGFIANKTLREASQMPLVGGQIMTGITPHLKKLGVTPEEFSRALTEKPPAPGKQSSLGTSGATDFSSRGRTPLAPQGLEAGNIDPASQPAVQNADGSISTVRTIGVGEEGGREVNIPTVPQEGGRIMSDQVAVQRYQDTGRHLGKYDSVDAAGRGAEALHQTEAREISQQPKGQQPTITPEMAKAIENAMKDQGRVPQAPVIPPEAQPVLPSQVAPMPGPQGPGGGGGAGLPLAPNGLNTGGFQPGMAMPGSQGGSIAMAGMLPPIQNATFSTPLLDSMATNQPFGSSSLSPIPFETLGGWGWGGGGFGGGGGFDFGGGFDIGGGGLDVGGSGLGMSMMGSLFSG
jgi:hypothetical protein